MNCVEFDELLPEVDWQWPECQADSTLEALPVRTITTVTNLRGVDLSGTELQGAVIRETDVFGAIFEPFSNPDARHFATARNLQFLTYRHDPSVLVSLLKNFEEGGFCEQEREITYALKQREAESSVWAKVSFTSSNEKVPLISGLPGTRITLIAISRVLPIMITFWLVRTTEAYSGLGADTVSRGFAKPEEPRGYRTRAPQTRLSREAPVEQLLRREAVITAT